MIANFSPSASRIIRFVIGHRGVAALAVTVELLACRICGWIGNLAFVRTTRIVGGSALSREGQVPGEPILFLCELQKADEVVTVEE